MAISSSILPYVALNKLIGREYYERLVRAILAYRKSAPPDVKGRLDSCLNRVLRLDGFKHPARAPVGRLAQEVLRHPVLPPVILNTFLDVWVESRPELRDAVRGYTGDSGAGIGEIFGFEGDALNGWATEMLEAVSAIRGEDQQFEEDDIALMICCLSDASQSQLFDEGGTDHLTGEAGSFDGAQAAAVEATGGDGSAPVGFGVNSALLSDWLDELAALPADAKEWGEVENFTRAVGLLAEAKREERAAPRRELGRTLAAFVSARGEALDFFGAAGRDAWSADACLPEEAAGAAETLRELDAMLDRHTTLQMQPRTSIATERERRRALDALEGEIVSALERLDAVLSPTQPAPDDEDRSRLQTAAMPDSPDACAETFDGQEREGGEGPSRLQEASSVAVPEVPEEDSASSQAAGGGEGAEAMTAKPPESDISTEANLPPPPDTARKEPEREASAPFESREVAASPAGPAATPSKVGEEALGGGVGAAGSPPLGANDSGGERVGEQKEIRFTEDQGEGREEGRVQPTYHFAPEQTAAEMAAIVLQGQPASRDEALRDLIWRLIFEEKLGLASHLAGGIEDEGGGAQPLLPAWMPRAVALGRHVRHANGDIARLLRDDFALFGDHCFVGGDSEWDHGVRFLCAAAAMRPALLAPNTNASEVLERLRVGPGLTNLYECCQTIAEHGRHRQALDLGALRGVRDAAAWRAEMDALRRGVEEWRARAPKFQMGKFSRASQVWRKWLEHGHLVHKLLLFTDQDAATELTAAKDEVERLSADAEIRREVDHIDRQVLKRRMGEEIIAKAFDYLRHRLREAVGFVRRWIELQETHPGQPRTYLQQQAEQLSRKMRGQQEAVRAELDGFERQHDSLFARAGVRVCRRALEDLWTLFDSETPIPLDEPPPRHLLHAEFLKSSTLPLDGHWEPCVPRAEVEEAVLRLVASGEVSWQSAFEAACGKRDHEATGRILEYLEAYDDPSAGVEGLRRRREGHVADCCQALKEDVAATRKEIEGAVASGLLREEERTALAAKVESVAAAADETLRFDEGHARLREVRAEISRQREEEKESVRLRLESAGLGPAHPAYERIRGVLERGDVWTANEYIDLTLQDRPLPSDEAKTNTFLRFFPQAARAICEFMESPSSADRPEIHKIVGDIRDYASGQRRTYAIGPVDMERVNGAQARRAAEMLEAWFSAKRRKQIDRLEARKILNDLGFSVGPSHVDVHQPGGRTWVALAAEPVRDRERCPVPAFGSQANGRYRVLCIWDRPTEEDLLGYVGDTAHGSPVLVFYFGRMTEQRRRELARRCRQRRRTFAVIDDTLALYLCGEPEPRLRAMFECALPFTFAEPYTTTAGLVPVEMFYGRERERRAIMDPMGSCFIYGGRQLGKTALLRDVERRFSEQEGHAALWFDLKSHGIGLDKNVDDLWGLLAAELGRAGVVLHNASRQMTVDRFLEHLQRWLDEDESRRLLLLLDEADDFLVYDGKTGDGGKSQKGEFVRAARLKGLMDRTHRRFKVVFAGLHNVQRTTRLANHPLAHYGEPICIGPLLDGGEWREARELVERPLATLGYSFETPDLVTRILWQTNYYPSLIQLYCNHLLRHVMDARHAPGFDLKNGPPYVITSRHVDDVYLSQDLRKAIRDRFIWTLQLDQRYEVIAYAMALYSVSDQERSTLEGFSVSWIRNEALTWWREGFRGSDSEDSVRALLDEMVGLGILRVVDASRYALRSTNVVLLMGTEEELESALERSREAPLQYEPATFRAAMRTRDGETAPRSPLTARQEYELRSRINGVSVVFGCRAAGLEELEPRLREVFGEEFFVNLDGTTDRTAFERRLSMLGGRERQGTTLVFVPASCPWSAQWVADAARRLRKLNSRSSFVRVLFAADPPTAWQFVSNDSTEADALFGSGVTAFRLGTWHDSALRQWLDDCRFPSDPATRERISAVTGGWPLLLGRFHELARRNMQAWERSLVELSDSLGRPETARALVAAWGLDGDEARKALRDLHALGEATAEELAEIMEDVAPETISRRLEWADRQGLVTLRGDERWRVDAVVGRLLVAAGN